jgi:hypothetical protein
VALGIACFGHFGVIFVSGNAGFPKPDGFMRVQFRPAFSCCGQAHGVVAAFLIFRSRTLDDADIARSIPEEASYTKPR